MSYWQQESPARPIEMKETGAYSRHLAFPSLQLSAPRELSKGAQDLLLSIVIFVINKHQTSLEIANTRLPCDPLLPVLSSPAAAAQCTSKYQSK